MLALYIDRTTWLHRLPAGAKLLALAAATVAVLPIDAPGPALAVLAGVIALYGSLGREGLRRLSIARPLVPLLLVLLLAQGLLASWGLAVAATARILAMVWLASLVTMTTRMDDMLDAVAVVLSPLRLVGLSPRTLALAVALVIRFAPVLLAEWQALSDSFRARTGRRPGIRLLAPFALRMIDLSEHVGEALAARSGPLQDERRRDRTP